MKLTNARIEFVVPKLGDTSDCVLSLREGKSPVYEGGYLWVRKSSALSVLFFPSSA